MPQIEKLQSVSVNEAPGQRYSSVLKVGHHHHSAGIIDPDPTHVPTLQVNVVFARLGMWLKASALEPKDVLKVRVYLVGDASLFSYFNEVWSCFFKGVENKPARTTVVVSALVAPSCVIEIEFDAVDQSN